MHTNSINPASVRSVEIRHEEFAPNARDGTHLFAQAWRSVEPPKAAACLVHGGGEHSSRYAHVGEFFARGGHATATTSTQAVCG